MVCLNKDDEKGFYLESETISLGKGNPAGGETVVLKG